MATLGEELGQLASEIEHDASVIGTEVIGALRAAYNGIRYGDIAAAISAFATVIQDAKNTAAILEKDAEAVVPQNVKDFISNGKTLNTVLPVPVLGNVVGVFYRGNSIQDLIDALAKGTTTL